MLSRAGATAVARLIAAAEQTVDVDAVLQIGQHRPLNYQGSGGDIPTLRADEGDLGRAVAQVWSVVMASNRTPWVFRFAGQPTWVVPDDEGRPVATILNEERLRHMLARLARWVRENAKGELLPAPPPVAVVKSVLATPDPALPVLTGIVNTPVFGRGGTLITAPGYHPDAPLYLIEKPSPGTGASVMTEGRDDEEWRKRVTAKLRQIPSIILIDNLRARLDSSAVAAALTAPFWEDRVLGQSEMTRLPIRCLWIATGNNPEFSNEMARRLVRIRLDANVEQPWQRAGFRHPDLMVWVRANRARIVAACLTLCQAWIAAGKPRGTRTIGSYENWAQVIGGVLETAGIPGFLGNLEEMMAASDSEGAGWSAFIAAWWDRFGTAEVAAADLFDVATFCDPAPPISGHTERAQKTAFGMSLTKMRDRVFDIDGPRVRMRSAGTYRRAAKWKLELFREDPRHPTQPKGESACEPPDGSVNLELGGSHGQPTDQNGKCEPCEPCEPFSTLTHARTRAHTKGEARIGSQGSQGSQTTVNSGPYACEPQCEPLSEGSH